MRRNSNHDASAIDRGNGRRVGKGSPVILCGDADYAFAVKRAEHPVKAMRTRPPPPFGALNDGLQAAGSGFSHPSRSFDLPEQRRGDGPPPPVESTHVNSRNRPNRGANPTRRRGVDGPSLGLGKGRPAPGGLLAEERSTSH